MQPIDAQATELLEHLYDAALAPEAWPDFLTRLAGLFRSETASLRLTDTTAPVVHQAFTVGYSETAERNYRESCIETDPFRAPLAAAPLGVILASHEVIADRDLAESRYYELVFRPNGNFYAMGAHFERRNESALHIGIHRPRSRGPYSPAERRTLQYFSPHLRRAAHVARRIGEFEAAARDTRAALDRTAFSVWAIDRDQRCKWANAPAEEAMRTGTLGLRIEHGRLTVAESPADCLLRAAVDAVNGRGPSIQTVPLGDRGATLVLLAPGANDGPGDLVAPGDETVLVFLFDPDRPTPLDPGRLMAVYDLTCAEIRLLAEFVRGLDLREAAACLGISIHTARAQMKSIMQKAGVNRQPELMRRLLLGSTRLGPPEPG